jgi:hypothetical protein
MAKDVGWWEQRHVVNGSDLIDRNRRLLAQAEAACVRKRQVVEEIAENRLALHVTLLRTLHLHYGRTGLLADAIYLRFSIAHTVWCWEVSQPDA